MKMNLKIFNNLSNPVAVQNVNGKDVEIHYMNETEYLDKYTQRGQFFVWTGDGKSCKLLIEKGFYVELSPLFSPKANELRLNVHDDLMKVRRRVYFGLFMPVLIIIIAALVLAYFVLKQYQMQTLIGSLLLLLLTNVIQTVLVNKKDEKLRHQYFDDLEDLIGAEQMQELAVKQREYFKNYFGEEDDEVEELEEEMLEEPEEEKEEPVVVVAPFVEEPKKSKKELKREAKLAEQEKVEEEVEEEVDVVEPSPVVEEEPTPIEEEKEELAEDPVVEEVEEPVVEERVDVVEPTPEKVVEEKPAPVVKERTEGEADLSVLTVDELKDFARDRKVVGFSTMKKGDLVEALPNEHEALRVVELQALARALEIPNFSTMRRDELIEAIKLGKPEVVEEVKEVEYVRVQIVGEDGEVDLGVLTVDELKEFAKDRKISGFSTMRKADLVEVLPNKLEELRVVELRALAREHEIANFSTMRRTELIEALKEGKLVEKTDEAEETPIVKEAKPAPKKVEEKPTPKKVEEKPTPKKVEEKPVPVVKERVEGEADLSVLTVDELKEFAKDRKVSGVNAMRKGELVEAIPSEFAELRVVELQALARALEIPNFSTMRRDELIEAIKLGKPEVVEEVKEVEYVRVQIVGEDGEVDLGVLTVDELKEFAKDRKISGFSTMRKADLVEVLPNKLEELRVVELQALAREHEIANFSTMRKIELIEALKEGKLVEKTDDVEGEPVKVEPKKEPVVKEEKEPIVVETLEGRVQVVNEDDTVDLSVLTVDELKEFAKDRKVPQYSAMRKGELVEALPEKLEELRLVELQAFAREHKLPHFSTMRRPELLAELRAGIPVKEERVVEEEPEEEIFVLNEDGTVNFNVLTADELKEFARDRKVVGFSTMRKADLVAAMPTNLEELRVVELQALARAKNVPNFSTMRKQELLEVIK